MEPTRMLCELIALPGVNPAFLRANDPPDGEARIAGGLAQHAAAAGLEV